MALINNSIESLYNGVSEQSSEHRQNTQVKEMINAYPSIDRGLLKRNPTAKLLLSNTITYDSNMWTHYYDRGLSGAEDEKYAVNIHSGGMEIVNVISGKVYKEGSGLTYSGDAKNYLLPYTGINGYAATTVKDTTFIVNKEVVPTISLLNPSGGSTTTSATIYQATIPFGPITTFNPIYNKDMENFGPSVLDGLFYEMYSGYVTFVVDGQSIQVNNIATGTPFIDYNMPTMSSWIGKVQGAFTGFLDTSKYVIEMDSSSNSLLVKRIDGSPITVSWSIQYIRVSDGDVLDPTDNAWQYKDDSQFLGNVTYNNYSGNVTTTSQDYLKNAYVWIKSSNPTAQYSYTVTVTDSSGNTATVTSSGTPNSDTTESAAQYIATTINSNANFSAIAVGSIVKISAASGTMSQIECHDTFGNQAMFGWRYEVQYHTDLPASLGFDGALCKINSFENGSSNYWLKYEDGVWKETVDTQSMTEINVNRMPHVLVRNSDDTFTLKPWDKWKNRLAGDEDSNPIPSFVQSADNPNPTIRDVFFLKNRLGLMTDRTIVLSEVGVYGNFWRTSTAALLDSDPIDAAVDTTKAIRLEYACYLEDSVMLFSDKVQFKLEGGKILSPTNVQISQTSAYEINKLIRPFYMNDKIFFCVQRGLHTAVMQYQVKSSNTSSEAIDITAHVQSYIPQDVTRLSGSSVNNMLFLSTKESDTLYCYKYYDSGEDRLQSAWFKWKYNGIVHNAFSLGKNLNIMIDRFNSILEEDWVLGSGTWTSANLWDSSLTWISLPSDLVSQNQFEIQQIAPFDYTKQIFKDNQDTIINTNVNFGEWVAEISGKKDIRANVKFKTVQISSEAGSKFSLYVIDSHRGDTRYIEEKYTVDRKPMVYGDTKNIEVGIISTSDVGFRINTVNYEGQYNSRSQKS